MSKDKNKSDRRLWQFLLKRYYYHPDKVDYFYSNVKRPNPYGAFMLDHEGGIGSNTKLVKELIQRGFVTIYKYSLVKRLTGDAKWDSYYKGVAKSRRFAFLTKEAVEFMKNAPVELVSNENERRARNWWNDSIEPFPKVKFME